MTRRNIFQNKKRKKKVWKHIAVTSQARLRLPQTQRVLSSADVLDMCIRSVDLSHENTIMCSLCCCPAASRQSLIQYKTIASFPLCLFFLVLDVAICNYKLKLHVLLALQVCKQQTFLKGSGIVVTKLNTVTPPRPPLLLYRVPRRIFTFNLLPWWNDTMCTPSYRTA